jgi:hypothetical protein
VSWAVIATSIFLLIDVAVSPTHTRNIRPAHDADTIVVGGHEEFDDFNIPEEEDDADVQQEQDVRTGTNHYVFDFESMLLVSERRPIAPDRLAIPAFSVSQKHKVNFVAVRRLFTGESWWVFEEGADVSILRG